MAKKGVTTHEFRMHRTPGFNAEASLYASAATYRSGGGSAGNVGAVQPAFVISPGPSWGIGVIWCEVTGHGVDCGIINPWNWTGPGYYY